MTYERAESVAGAWILAGVVLMTACLLGVCACQVVARVREVIGRERGLTRQARTAASGFPSIDSAVYPDPPCEWCGAVGAGCICEGREFK